MKYFCDVQLEAKQNEGRRIFIVLPEVKGVETPNLTREILLSDVRYKEFASRYRSMIFVTYDCYKTEEDVENNTADEIFAEIIADGRAKSAAATQEMTISAKDKIKKKKDSLKITQKVIAIAAGCLLLVMGAGLVGGLKLGGRGADLVEELQSEEKAEDGMIIPAQEKIEENADQITVSIDRSYAPVPTEDLELKNITDKDGVAEITLPAFDKTDYFSHVAGHTWGFTSDPNGEKIAYYGGMTYKFKENTRLYRVLVEYGGGSGTQDDPYRIDYFDQLELMAQENVRGYFKQTADIEFPDWQAHTPINTVNVLKSAVNTATPTATATTKTDDFTTDTFHYDGGGYSISGLTDSFFGSVSGAVIENVTVKKSDVKPEYYEDFGFIVGRAYNYQFKNGRKIYTTDETIIRHCVVLDSTYGAAVEKDVIEENSEPVDYAVEEMSLPDEIEYDEEGNIIQPEEQSETVRSTKYGQHNFGGIVGLGGQVEDCFVQNCTISGNLEEYMLNVGGIGGKPSGVKNCAVSGFTTNGNIFNAGGIVDSAEGARLYNVNGAELPESDGGNVQGCLALNCSLSAELSGGGLVGTATSNTENALISNSYCKGISFQIGETDDKDNIIESGFIGGIIGTDGTNPYGHKVMNTVSPFDYPVIGQSNRSSYDDTVCLAPDFAYYQENILTVLNRNTVHPDKPEEIFTGNFTFENSPFSTEEGKLAYPKAIQDLVTEMVQEGENGE